MTLWDKKWQFIYFTLKIHMINYIIIMYWEQHSGATQSRIFSHNPKTCRLAGDSKMSHRCEWMDNYVFNFDLFGPLYRSASKLQNANTVCPQKVWEYDSSVQCSGMEFFSSGNMTLNQPKKTLSLTQPPFKEHSQSDGLRAISQLTLKHYMSNNRM